MTTKTLQDEILKLKKEKGAVILAHSYQTPDVLEIADYTGDSFKLSTIATEIKEDTIILCGVKFMAETVKILSPEKTVIMPVAEATCPMAEQISPERVKTFKEENPDVKVVAYINTTAALKACCDVCVTSSSALKIVNRLDAEKILFIPDKNLGSYIKDKVTDKEVILWDGFCPVHNEITEEECVKAKALHPDAKLLMHPEIPLDAVKYADVTGSTADIINYALDNDEDCIIGTELAVLQYLKLKRPERNYYPLSKKLICADMKLTTLTDVYNALNGNGEEVILDENLRLAAKKPIDEMIRLGS